MDDTMDSAGPSTMQMGSNEPPGEHVEEAMESDDASRQSTPDPEMLQEYEQLMSTILEIPTTHTIIPAKRLAEEVEDDSVMENGVKRPMTKAEKQNAKKKRRKERERDAKADEVLAKREEKEKEEMAKPVSFRLFSERPVLDVSLLHQAEDYALPPNPRHVPLPPTEQDLIRNVAQEAAIDPVTLLAGLDSAGLPRKSRRPRRVRMLHADTSVPEIFIVSEKTGGKTAKPKSGSIPRIDLYDADDSIQPAKRPRTKRPKRQ